MVLDAGCGQEEPAMSNRTRAYRRHHRLRMIKNASRKVFYFDDPEWEHNYILRNYNHLAACSCFMCGNPRHNDWASKKERLTIQERKVYNLLSEELEEYYYSR